MSAFLIKLNQISVILIKFQPNFTYVLKVLRNSCPSSALLLSVPCSCFLSPLEVFRLFRRKRRRRVKSWPPQQQQQQSRRSASFSSFSLAFRLPFYSRLHLLTVLTALEATSEIIRREEAFTSSFSKNIFSKAYSRQCVQQQPDTFEYRIQQSVFFSFCFGLQCVNFLIGRGKSHIHKIGR